MAEKLLPYLRGIEGGKLDDKGIASRPGCKAVVVFQPFDSDDPVPYGWFTSEEDAKDYLRSLKVSGAASGLRIVKPSEIA